MKYMVTFEFKNEQGKWVKDFFSNNGAGFSYNDALDIAQELNSTHDAGSALTRNERIERLEKEVNI